MNSDKTADGQEEGSLTQEVKVDRPIVLVGLMGVGKTTVGKRLAALLNLPFEDCDDAVEKAAGMTVSEIFERYGEDEFRRGERRVIDRLMQEDPKVIATGGGAFVNDETRALIKEKGVSIWLHADVETLAERTRRRDTRPLLRGKNHADVLGHLLKERAPYYAQADLKVESRSGPHSDVVDRIMAALSNLTEPCSASAGDAEQ